MQLGHPCGQLMRKAVTEQGGEQMVVAPPSPHLVQRHHKQVCPLQRLQQRLTAAPAGDRVAQRATQPVQHRGLQHEEHGLLGLAGQHLLGQVIEHEAVAAGERRNEPDGIGVALQRQRG